jgi:isoquinoline 1-oxidoreductase alpha subunit
MVAAVLLPRLMQIRQAAAHPGSAGDRTSWTLAVPDVSMASTGIFLQRASVISDGGNMRLSVNGVTHTVDVPGDMPLLWVLRDVIGMTGTKFGCGIAACGACTVHIDGQPTRSCVTPVSALAGKQVTTIEAIGNTADGRKIQEAWIALDVPQCGYCQSGQIMSAAALLGTTPHPTDRDIDSAMSGNICRCGTYGRIRAAIKQAAGSGLVATKGA